MFVVVTLGFTGSPKERGAFDNETEAQRYADEFIGMGIAVVKCKSVFTADGELIVDDKQVCGLIDGKITFYPHTDNTKWW